MSELAISLKNLTVEYKPLFGKRVRAVDGLSFDIQKGEVIGFLGPNGAGKSTTLKTLMGFQMPSSGTAEIFGMPAGSVTAKRRVGFLPEVALYYPFLTPCEILTLYGKLQDISSVDLNRQVNDLINRVGLAEKRNTQCRNLSKGQQQRVGIAQSLLGNPDLLILDEVTSGLDPVGRRDLRNLLNERRNQGVTIFFSSHELTEVEMLCDRIIIINKGKLIDEQSVSSMRTGLQQYYIKFAPPIPLTDLNAIWTEDTGVVTAYFPTPETQIAALKRIIANGSNLLDIGVSDRSLEDYFVETIDRSAA